MGGYTRRADIFSFRRNFSHCADRIATLPFCRSRSACEEYGKGRSSGPSFHTALQRIGDQRPGDQRSARVPFRLCFKALPSP
jgi:hypothetical protein